MDSPMFTLIDDEYHIIGGDELTLCAIPVPFANGYTNDRPDKVCAECAEKGLGETPTGKPKETEREPLFPAGEPTAEPLSPETTKADSPKVTKKAANGKRTKA